MRYNCSRKTEYIQINKEVEVLHYCRTEDNSIRKKVIGDFIILDYRNKALLIIICKTQKPKRRE